MPRRPITNPMEYVQIALRRWLWIVVPAVVIAGLTAVVVKKMPKMYQSSSLILIEPQRVPTDMVQPTVSGTVMDRLEYIQEQILSRTQLSEIIQKYGLYHGEGLTAEGQVEQMRKDITVQPVMDPNSARVTVSAFRIQFQGRSRVLAQQVTQDLSTLFLTENLRARSQQAQGTEEFISGQVAQASQTLQGLETQLRNLKSQYMGSLPQQQQANLQVMGQLQTVMQNDDDAIARAQQQKTYLTSLAQAVAKLGPGAAGSGAAAPDPLQVQLQQAKANLAAAEQMYTPAYPDVIGLKAQVKALTQQVAAEAQPDAPAPSAAAGAKSAVATAKPRAAGGKRKATETRAAAASAGAQPQLIGTEKNLPPDVQGQLVVLNQEIAHREADEKATRAKIAEMQQRLELLPEVEEKLANVQNADTVAKANYTSLLEKQQAAETGAAMEQQAEGEEFKIVDPADLPQKPSKPNVDQLLALGCGGGLIVGLLLAFWAEMRDAVVRGEADMAYYVAAPMLAALPQLRLAEARGLRRKERA